MNNKNILIAVLVVVVLVLGFLYMRKTSSPVEIPNTNSNTSNSQASGKLNIDAVCKGALAYMTFTDGAASDKFVADCKVGKHPEVIEKYKADMNLGEGTQI